MVLWRKRKIQIPKLKVLLFSGKAYVTFVIFIDFWWCFHRCGWILLVFCRFYEWKKIFLAKKEHISPPTISFIKMFINESVKWEQNFNAWPFVQTISTHSLTPKKSSFSVQLKALSWFDNANAKQRVCESITFL